MSRRSGRVILLSKESVTFPSDLQGLGWIDVTQGLASDAKRSAVNSLLFLVESDLDDRSTANRSSCRLLQRMAIRFLARLENAHLYLRWLREAA